MKGPREYRRIIAKIRKREARRFGVRNGGLPWLDSPGLERLVYNSKRKIVRPTSAALAALTLTACSTTSEPRIVTKEVKVPVAVNCTSNIPPPAQHPDSDAALRGAPSLAERVKLLLAGRATRSAEIVELRASVAGCR